MPRKTKEIKENITKLKEDNLNAQNISAKTKKTSKTTTKKTSTAKKSTTKKNSSTIDEKSVDNKIAKKSNSKKTTNSSVSTKKKSTKKSNSTRNNTANKKAKKIDIVEYYDLPYRYNQTIVKVLAQTPNHLFIYWDISDTDRENYKKQFGDNFFENTKPVLIIHNTTMNYSFEIEINDFANSWYLHVNDAKCDYTIELGRRPIVKTPELENTDYIYISTSNHIEAPNNHILFNKEQKMVYFRNVKTGVQTSKPFSTNLSFIRNMGKVYNIYDIYKAIYKNEKVEEIYNLSNPSSSNPSSNFK